MDNTIIKTNQDGGSMKLVFNRAELLQRLMADEEMALAIILCFLEDIPNQISALKNYLNANDSTGAVRTVHSIKGAAANIGGDALWALALDIERDGKLGDLASVQSKVAKLEETFAELMMVLKIELHAD